MCMCTCACAWAFACGFVCGTGFHRTRYVRACECVHACPYAHGISRTVVQWTAIQYECLRRATITHRASASGSRRVYLQHAACDKHSVHHAAQCKVQHHIRQHARALHNMQPTNCFMQQRAFSISARFGKRTDEGPVVMSGCYKGLSILQASQGNR